MVHPRLEREFRTVAAMVAIYCDAHHAPGAEQVCAECRRLLDYVSVRLGRCPFQENKPTCARCTVHCYRLAERDQIKRVMRYAGPRMLHRHPVLALAHWWDARRPAPSPVPSKKP